jgi:L-lactate transport
MNPVWQQKYLIWGQSLPVSAAIAAIPILLLLYLLGVRRRPAWEAALAGLIAAAALAVGAYGLSVVHFVSAAAYGAAFGVFPITWIIFWALALYRLTVETGNFEIIKESVGSITADKRLQMLLIAFAFGAFLEGAAGFGTPVAVAAAMLMGLGFSPMYASASCLLANTAPVAFGSIGIPVVTLAGITGLPLGHLTADVGRICAPISFILPAYLIVVMCGWQALGEVWPALLVCGTSFAGMQFLISNFVGAQLTDIGSSLAAIFCLIVLLRFWKPATKSDLPDDRFHTEGRGTTSATAGQPAKAVFRSGSSRESAVPVNRNRTSGEIARAWTPYVLLVVFVLLWGVKPVQNLLNTVTFSIPWPHLHNEVWRTPPVVTKAAPYPALYAVNWLAAAGTACMVAFIASGLALRVSLTAMLRIVGGVTRSLLLPTATVSSMLALAFVMNYSGATSTLGLAFSATGVLFPFFSSLLGWLGVFLTGSDTSANALFGSLQVVTAQKLGLGATLMAASNSAGGVMGKMISLQTIAVAAAATGLTQDDQAQLFRFTLRHSLILAGIVGLEVLIYSYVFRIS